MDRATEFAQKRLRLIEMLDRMQLDMAVIGSVSNFAWLSCGGSNYVGTATQIGAAYILVSREGHWVVCDNIEYPRLVDEELYDLGFEYVVSPWYNFDLPGSIARVFGKQATGSDCGLANSVDLGAQIRELRTPLLEAEMDRYSELGKIVGQCIAEAAGNARRGETENQIVSELNRLLLFKGIVPTCSLAAADARIHSYRHPLPTDNPIDRQLMLITGARKWGLIVSATRVVCFGDPDENLQKKHAAVVRVDAELISRTRPGAVVGSVLQAGIEKYAACGYPEEWFLHHQGGPTGYEAREFKVTPQHTQLIALGSAYAWNPSITGTKSEDTILVGEAGNTIISESAGWPVIEVQTDTGALHRPDILVR